MAKTKRTDDLLSLARPLVQAKAHELQPYGHLVKLPIALSETVCRESVENLNQVLADTMVLRDMYKKHHWQVTGHTFYQLHLLFDKHYTEQAEMVDEVAEPAGDGQEPAEALAGEVRAWSRHVEHVDGGVERGDVAGAERGPPHEEPVEVEAEALGVRHRPERHRGQATAAGLRRSVLQDRPVRADPGGQNALRVSR